jgi:2-keto-4-pentenoate hydratase/2-oxohepta-3-ene-1,7-dioic acid hydratase in catechol pathway
MKLLRTSFGLAVLLPSGEPLHIRHIIGIGMNYAAHAREQGKGLPERPVLFTKNPAAAILDGDEIVVPNVCQEREQVDFEGELAVLLARPDMKPIRDIPKSDALSCVLGYCVANDVSARWWQREGSGGQFCRGKSFDTFCPLGPHVTPAANVPNPHALRLQTRLNGVTMQDASTADMIFDIPTLISDLSRGTTLLPGTLILTGTPSGVGMARSPQVFLKHGDLVEIEIETLGIVRNRVRFE